MKISPTDLILNLDGSVYHLNLRPENISSTIITVGDPGRVPRVSKYFDSVDFQMNKREFITHTGTFDGKHVTVMSTGMGTDNIEIFFNEIDALVNIDLKTREPKSTRKKLKVIRVGTSGALQEDIKLGSHLVSDFAIGLDNLMTFYNLPMDKQERKISNQVKKATRLPLAPYVVRGSRNLIESIGAGMIQGNTITCPGFYAPQGRTLRATAKFPKLLDDLHYFHVDDFRLTNFEMETAGYYALGRLLEHDVVSVNAILANRITNKFSKDPDKVVDALIKTVLERI